VLELPDQLKGVKIFPCQPHGKHPATKEGWHIATDDPEQIAKWHAVNPDFNWAVATGLSGLFVIDVDPNGLDWWAKLLERDPAIREAVDRAYQVRTPRGGLHVYFKGEGPSTASRIAEGIDTRGGIQREGKIVSGGYVLLPGSKTEAGSYSALPGGAVLPLPSIISAIVPERKKTDTLGLNKNPDADQPRNVQWALDLIKNYVQAGRVSVEGRGGNNLAFQVAASILDKAVSAGTCFDLLWEHWNPYCSPPWDDWELEQIVRNAASYGEDTEGGVKGFQANADAFSGFEGQGIRAAGARGARARQDSVSSHLCGRSERSSLANSQCAPGRRCGHDLRREWQL
jgi:Bifunctional DNA primase/polymerase, N-terminal.